MRKNLKKILAVVITSAMFAGGLPAEVMAAQADMGIVSVKDDSGEESVTEREAIEERVHGNENREESGSISAVQDEENESTSSDSEDVVSESVSKVDEKGESGEKVEAEEEIRDEERNVRDTEVQESESEESTIEELVILSLEGTYTPEGADYSLKYKVINGTSVTITGISDKNATGKLVIPSEIDGVKVTSIGGGAFSGCSGLTGSLTIPNNVTDIGPGAFSECKWWIACT